MTVAGQVFEGKTGFSVIAGQASNLPGQDAILSGKMPGTDPLDSQYIISPLP
jgi:hypothetical protein